jgi:N-methylhydantoinase A
MTVEEMLQELEELRARASESFVEDGIPESRQLTSYQADVRYAGQAFQLSLGFTAEEIRAQGLAVLTDEFDRQHSQLFTFAHGKDHEIVILRAVVKARNEPIAEVPVGVSGKTLEDCRIHETAYYYEGSWREGYIYDRNLLVEDMVVPGPAIVQEMDSTTLILPGYAATVDSTGNLLINPACLKGSRCQLRSFRRMRSPSSVSTWTP